MGGVRERFGDLRALFQRPHDASSWETLCALLEGWPDDHSLVEEALPYCLDHLTTWPQGSHDRAPSRAWLDALLGGDDVFDPVQVAGVELSIEYRNSVWAQRKHSQRFERNAKSGYPSL